MQDSPGAGSSCTTKFPQSIWWSVWIVDSDGQLWPADAIDPEEIVLSRPVELVIDALVADRVVGRRRLRAPG